MSAVQAANAQAFLDRQLSVWKMGVQDVIYSCYGYFVDETTLRYATAPNYATMQLHHAKLRYYTMPN